VQKVRNGQAWAAIVFNGDAAVALEEDSTLRFTIPDEGSSIWVDVMTLSAGAPNPQGAHQFVDFLLRAEEGARLAAFVRYGSPNEAATAILDRALLENETIYPSEETRRRLLFLKDLDEAGRLYAEAWTHAKTD
jgi:spermidine/putrescine transport system substrate-binding protein